VCRHPLTGKYLLCQEFASQGFWLPGGACDGGESFTQAARREAMEEAGLNIDLKGILEIEYNPNKRSTDRAVSAALKKSSGGVAEAWVKLRVTFYAEVAESDLHLSPKCIPDFESAGAAWCSAEEICEKKFLRGNEPKHWANYLENGGVVYPLSILKEEK